MCYTPEKSCGIITALAVLHNICIEFNVKEPDDFKSTDLLETESDSDDDFDASAFQTQSQDARVIRDRTANTFQAQR